MIKHKLLKYTLIAFTLIIFLIIGLLWRVIHKPFDIMFVTKYIGQEALNEILPINDLKYASVQLKLFENTFRLNLDNVKEFDFSNDKVDAKVLISSAKNLNLDIKASKLLRKKLYVRNLNINDANIKVLLNKEDFTNFQSNDYPNLTALPTSLEKVSIKNTELNVHFINDSKKLTFKGLDFKIFNTAGKIEVNKIKASYIEFENNNKKNRVKISKPEFFVNKNYISGKAKQISFLNFQSQNKIIDILKNLNIPSNEVSCNDIYFESNFKRDFFIESSFNHLGKMIPLEVTFNF